MTRIAGAGRGLAGLRVLVTRPRDQGEDLGRLLQGAGVKVRSVPLIETVAVTETGEIDAAIRRLDSYRWVIVTSANAARHLADRLTVLGVSPKRIQKLLAIGPATRTVLEQLGLPVDLVPRESRAEGVLAELLPRLSPGDRVLLPRARSGREVLPEGLRERGITVDVVALYETRTRQEARGELVLEVFGEGVDVITFFSGSAVEAFQELTDGRPPGPAVAVACVGPVTAARARDLGYTPAIVAREQTPRGLLEALAEHYRSLSE